MNGKLVLKVGSALIFLIMTIVTIRTSLTVSLWAAWPGYAANPWAVATLYDAYCGFTLFWFWVVYRETSWTLRIVWLVLIFGLGNIATAAYVFLAVSRLKQEESLAGLFQRRST
jgi:hypothetical protein